jgi:ribosomal protein S18 acetylase RimI-like enzyme
VAHLADRVTHLPSGELGGRPLQRILAMAAPTYAVAKLDVDSENADGAGRLYESAGFVRQRSNAIYIQS